MERAVIPLNHNYQGVQYTPGGVRKGITGGLNGGIVEETKILPDE